MFRFFPNSFPLIFAEFFCPFFAIFRHFGPCPIDNSNNSDRIDIILEPYTTSVNPKAKFDIQLCSSLNMRIMTRLVIFAFSSFLTKNYEIEC